MVRPLRVRQIGHSKLSELVDFIFCSLGDAFEVQIDVSHGHRSGEFLHHDPVALDFVQTNLDRAAALAAATSGASTVPRILPLARNRTTRQRRFIRPASLAGLSFLLDRRGRMAKI